MARLGAFPGSFNPPTIAHLAIASRAREQHDLDRIDLVVSRKALAKEEIAHPHFEHRVEVLRQSVAGIDWLAVNVTDQQLLVDIADGYDVLIMGADKWWQIRQTHWYESAQHRDAALDALPTLAVVPRHGFDDPPDVMLSFDADTYGMVSSTRARNGELELMTRAAQEFSRMSGAWIDLSRYQQWVADQACDL